MIWLGCECHVLTLGYHSRAWYRKALFFERDERDKGFVRPQRIFFERGGFVVGCVRSLG